ncbi:MAG: hypothetical protein LC776_03050 [Acidobacteria bacterium]|nr:hypothetical protein [Acidobacteriota bacterium]
MAPSGQAPRILNPIWLISLFVGLTEVTTGIAATQTSGWTQKIFTIFSVLFPSMVASLFFLILWKKPAVLYAPGDYTEQTSVSTFASALSSSANRNYATIESVIQSTIETILPPLLEGSNSTDRKSVVNKAVAAAHRDLLNRIIEVDLSSIYGTSQEPLRIPVSDSSTVSEVLNQVWRSIAEYFDPFTINKDWFIVDSSTGAVLDKMGAEWARKNLGTEWDYRLIGEVGITPGARWKVQVLKPAMKRALRNARP